MVSIYPDQTKEDFLRDLIKYSVPLYERKPEPEEDELSDLVKDVETNDTPKNQVYMDNYQQDRLLAPYASVIGAYLDRRIEAMHDFSDRVPGKQLNTFPVSGNEGLFGYTFLGDVKIWRRDDLTGDFAKMVDIHESIHTPDEYETRILTDWIMSKQPYK